MAKKRKRPQQSKAKRKYQIYDPNAMSDYRFDLGDKDGGYNNWIPYKDRDEPPTDYGEYATKATMKSLLPAEGQKRNKNKRYK